MLMLQPELHADAGADARGTWLRTSSDIVAFGRVASNKTSSV